MTPWYFRPCDDPRSVPDHLNPEQKPDQVEWEDNWLSNSLAWLSWKAIPTWCEVPEHWTSRFANFVFTSCPCCATFRGITCGVVGSSILWLLVLVIVVLVR